MISQELQTALMKVQKKYPDIIFEKYLLKIFIGKLSELIKKYEFTEARRYALNMCNMWDKKTRDAYKSLAGTYFGRRGGIKKPQKNIISKKSVVTERMLEDARINELYHHPRQGD